MQTIQLTQHDDRIVVKHYKDLSKDELYQILQLRTKVFVVEQECPYLETDGLDQDSYHLYFLDEGEMIAYCRILPKTVAYEDACSIGRVIATRRREGLGTKLIEAGIEFARDHLSAKTLRIAAIDYAQDFYEQNGFVQSSDPYPQDGQVHVEMEINLEELRKKKA